MTIDLDFIRKQFPAFSEPSLEGFANFENAGGSFACRQVIERLDRFYRQTRVQPFHAYGPSREAGLQMLASRRRMAKWLNVKTDEVHFGPSTSQNTYVVAQALRELLQPGDELVVTNQDHEANVGVWRRLEASGIVIREWKVDTETAELDPQDLYALLNERTRAVAYTHCSNIVGSIHPVREINDRIHEAGAIAIVDGVSYAPHGMPDVDALGADIYKFSLYKVYGPHLGAMVMRSNINEMLPNQGHFFNAGLPGARFTPAGPDHAQVASVNGVIDYMEAVHDHHFGEPEEAAVTKGQRIHDLFQQQERERIQPVLEFLSAHSRVRVVGRTTPQDRAPTVSFTVSDQASTEVASRLAAENIGVGAGHCYAYRLIEALGIDIDDGVVRTSLLHYTSEQEVTRLIETLDRIL